MPRWLPTPLQSVRVRLSVLNATLLFGIATLAVFIGQLALSRSAADEPVTKTFTAVKGVYKADGSFKPLEELEVTQVADIEEAANAAMLDTLRGWSWWTLLALFAVSLVIGWFLSGRAFRPLRQIASAAEAIGGRDLSRRIRLTGPDDEFHRLADTLDTMLARLDDAFAVQRRLLDDASHELRNPLAIIQSNTDAVLLADDADEDERREAALVVSRASRRMTRLVEDLLAAARQTTPAFADAMVDLATLAEQEVADTTRIVEQRRQRLRLLSEGSSDNLVVPGDHDALRRAVANLLSNAMRFTPEGGDITVATGRSDTWCWLAVVDDGPGVPAASRDRVFDRFWRADGHGAPRSGHAGLGLSIVRQVVEGHRGEVHLHQTPGGGATFVIWLPARGTAVDEQSPPAGNPVP